MFNELRKREFFMSKGEKKRLNRAAGRRRHLKEIKKRLEEHGFQKAKEQMDLLEHENATKTLTPKKEHHPFSWWLKWTSSIILIVAPLPYGDCPIDFLLLFQLQ